MRNRYIPMCKGGEGMSLYSIENQQLKFTFDTDDGLMCRSIYHKAGKKEWLKEESPPLF